MEETKTTVTDVCKCEHFYEPVMEKYETWEKNYIKSGQTDYCKLVHERTKIFCRKCWDFKELRKI